MLSVIQLQHESLNTKVFVYVLDWRSEDEIRWPMGLKLNVSRQGQTGAAGLNSDATAGPVLLRCQSKLKIAAPLIPDSPDRILTTLLNASWLTYIATAHETIDTDQRLDSKREDVIVLAVRLETAMCMSCAFPVL